MLGVLHSVVLLLAFAAHPRPSRLRAARCTVTSPDADGFVLDEQSVAQLVEAAFVPAVMGIARGDVTELKLLIAAAQAGLERDCAIDALGQRMRALPVQSAGRPLATEEDDLRTLWLALAYMTLSSRGIGSGTVESLVPAVLYAQHRPFVEQLIEAKASGRPLSELSVDELAGTSTSLRTSMQAAVLKQSMRVVYTTMDVLADVEAAGQRADAPRPFIPGQEGSRR
jgi:hypothetical protein